MQFLKVNYSLDTISDFSASHPLYFSRNLELYLSSNSSASVEEYLARQKSICIHYTFSQCIFALLRACINPLESQSGPASPSFSEAIKRHEK